MNTLEQFVANELGTVIANQSIKIAKASKRNGRNAKKLRKQRI